jgi:hypothetical protein
MTARTTPLDPPHDQADQKDTGLPDHLKRLKRMEWHNASADGKRFVAEVENFGEEEWLSGFGQVNPDGANARRRCRGRRRRLAADGRHPACRIH